MTTSFQPVRWKREAIAIIAVSEDPASLREFDKSSSGPIATSLPRIEKNSVDI